MCLTQWKISWSINHRGLNMWCNYVLKNSASRDCIRLLAAPFRFNSQRIAWNQVAYTYDRRLRFSVFIQRKLFHKKEAKRPLRLPRFTSLLSRCDFQKYPTKVFRISFSVLRSQYAAVLQPEALVASVSRHSHNTGRFALSSEKITHFACISLELAFSFSLFTF